MSARYLGGVIAQTQLPLNPAAGNAANGVFTMSQYMQAVKNATWPSFDPYFNETVLLLHGNGTNGAQNNTFLDGSTNNFTITRNGNTTQGTFSPFSVAAGEWSNYFTGDDSSIQFASTASYGIGTGNFTVELWANFSSIRGQLGVSTWHNRLYTQGVSGTDGIMIDLNQTGLQVGITNSYFSYSWLPEVGRWYHIALVRSGTGTNQVALYVDGVVVATGTNGNSVAANNINIGSIEWTTNWGFNGYISNVRFSDTARTITVPTSPYVDDANTLLLTCQSNRFVDNATPANTTVSTFATAPRVTPFSPFAPSAAYSAGTNGGSGYFDGSGDWLQITKTGGLNGTGDFTIEFWYYPVATTGMVFNSRSGGTNGDGIDISTTLNVTTSGAVLLSAITITTNTWTHVAIVRSGTTLSRYVNGTLNGSTTASQNFTGTTFMVGGSAHGNIGYLTGYMSNFRQTNSAVYTSAFTPPTSPLTAISNTSLLLNFTNAGIIDNTGKNNLETVGNAQIDTAVKKFGDGSLEFDGTGDYLQLNSSTNDLFNFGTGDFTIECWFYRGSLSGRQDLLGRYVSTPAGWGLGTSVTNNGDVVFYYGNTVIASTAGSIWSINTWSHVAVVRSATSLVIYVNGTSRATATDSTNMSAGNPLQISASGSTSMLVNGYIDDLRITKGVARYTANFAVPYLPQGPLPLVGGPYIPNTVLMLPGTGTNGAQNNTFLDSSTNNFTITRNGNTTQGTFSPFSRANGYWGNYFDGTGDFLTTPSNSAFDFGTGDFTVEFWAYVQTTSGFTALVGTRTGDTSSTIRWSMYIESSSSSLTTEIYNTSNTSMGFIIFQSTFPRNQWVHCALVRSGTSFRLYQNGVQSSSSITSSTAVANSSTVVRVGDFDSSVVADLNGYISNLRIVKGTAVYTSNFTPTGPLTAIANTSLLTCQSNRFIDNSTNNFTITRNGDVRVVTFSPFEYLTAYSPTTNGGSGYFDGTGDSLTRDFTSTTDGMYLQGSTYTIEAWVYPNALSGTQYIYICNASNVTQYGYNTLYLSGTSVAFATRASTGGTEYARTGGTLTVGQWAHIAVSVNSNVAKLFLNGVQVGADLTIAANTFTPTGVGIGRNQNGAAGGTDFNGYISNLRVVQGTAVYTSAFTPPTAPVTAISGTSLLCNFTNAGIYDASMTNDLETVGNAQVSTTQSKWGGGSMYFDGSGDYLVAPSVTELTLNADFTIEGWAYLNASGNYRLLTLGDAIGTSGIEIYVSSGNWVVYSNNATRITGSAATRQVWTHIAVVRSGSTVALYINGAASGSTWSSSASFSGRLFVGAEFYNSGITADTNGFISDLRILNGVAILPTPLQTSQWQDQ